MIHVSCMYSDLHIRVHENSQYLTSFALYFRWNFLTCNKMSAGVKYHFHFSGTVRYGNWAINTVRYGTWKLVPFSSLICIIINLSGILHWSVSFYESIILYQVIMLLLDIHIIVFFLLRFLLDYLFAYLNLNLLWFIGVARNLVRGGVKRHARTTLSQGVRWAAALGRRIIFSKKGVQNSYFWGSGSKPSIFKITFHKSSLKNFRDRGPSPLPHFC